MDSEDNRLILDALEDMCASREFAKKPVMQKLITHLVTEYVSGRSHRLKGLTIAADVFDWSSGSNSDGYAVVRNAAVRLRRLLKLYYLEEGIGDAFRIEIPKGTYVPSISRNNGTGTEYVTRNAARRPSVAISPLRNLTGSQDTDYIALGFSQQLSDTLTRYEGFRIIGLSRRVDDDETAPPGFDRFNGKIIDFLVDGDIRSSGNRLRISLRLIDRSDHSTVWTDSLELEKDADDLFEQQDDITRRIAARIGDEYYGLINQRRYQSILQSKPRSLNEQDLLLKWYQYQTVLTEQVARDFHKAVFKALEEEPESALLNVFAGDIYGNIYTLDFPGAEQALEKFEHHVEKAYSINPHHQIIKGNLAFKCFVFGERERFFRLLDEDQAWMPPSSYRLGGMGLMTCLFGEWERGKKMIDAVIDNNLQVPGWLHWTVALYHYRRSEYEQALEEVDKCQIQGLHWKHIHRIAALGQLGRLEEARSEFQVLLQSRPNFVERGRYLMGILIKEASLLEHLAEGFAKMGVKLA